MSTPNQILRKIEQLNTKPGCRAVVRLPVREGIKELIQAGLVESWRLQNAQFQPTGDVWLRLTDAGRARIYDHQPTTGERPATTTGNSPC